MSTLFAAWNILYIKPTLPRRRSRGTLIDSLPSAQQQLLTQFGMWKQYSFQVISEDTSLILYSATHENHTKRA
jgi:hypothetical protein